MVYNEDQVLFFFGAVVWMLVFVLIGLMLVRFSNHRDGDTCQQHFRLSKQGSVSGCLAQGPKPHINVQDGLSIGMRDSLCYYFRLHLSLDHGLQASSSWIKNLLGWIRSIAGMIPFCATVALKQPGKQLQGVRFFLAFQELSLCSC